ncbi:MULTISPECIES: TonB-dependent receptor [unclassified Pseudomonas]|uniref:TonB-denpendent receptor n=1 Tax=Pseudomonas gorinensis TaxID=3240790 RepID=A0ACA7P9F9_9PSED|nr:MULTISPECIES: TonB-dependent receptor [unclassified Pseudomonas]AHC36647.1 TonB-denpendent receptor [Pseudomonas sp. TKP]PMX12716.1 TonB-dependent receptor [Pseudomonas sp. MPBC4-3]PMX48598.1 TonB-dependent receptor [Pseudomonas sp. FW301-21B01]PMY08249.1 TonB-dependent receptor [Pseudomonas sp. MPR-R5A]PNA70864.1 TonB-dependent receptor [Pseudomonas sp. MPR-R5B]
MPAPLTLPCAKRVCVSRSLWPLLSVGLFAINPLPLVLAEASRTEDSTLTLGTVTVQGATGSNGPLSTSSVLSSVDVLGADILEKMPVNYSWELFSRAPGVMLTEFNQGTTSGKISFRGFNGEGEVNAVKLLIDGIPSNSNDGNMPFMDMIFPLELDSIEVVRGTSDARYGLNNIAGNVNMLTRTGGDYTKARIRYGSYNTQETQLAKGIESSNWTQNYFFAYQKSDGYRDHAQADKFSMAGKWFYTPDDNRYRIGLIARHYETEAQEPGYLSEEDAHQHPTMTNSYNATDKGTRRMNQLSVHFDTELSDTLAWAAKTYVNTFDDRRWTQYWRTSAQQERDAYETQYGALTSLTWRPEVSWLYDFALEGGADMQQQQNKSERYRTKDRVRQAQTRDQQFDFDTYGAYVQAEIKPFESLKIIPAYRVDKIQGDFTNEMTGLDYDINDYGLIKQPKLSVVYSPWDVASVYANWGRTFQVGTGAAAYKIPPRDTDLAPSINEGWETGIKFTPADWIDGRVAYWQQKASGEVSRRLNDPSGESDNVGQTRRWGYDAQVNLHPNERTDLWMAYAWQYSKILQPSSTLPNSKGQEIDHIPHHLYNAGVSYKATPALQLTAWMNGQTNYYLERENTRGTYGGYVLMNLGASYRVTESVSVDLQLKNLTNRYYEYVWYDPDGAQASLHSPGDGRALYTGVSVDF